MSKYLVIVESPAKARTIHAILGDSYDVVPSMGHVIDLPSSTLAIDIEKGFAPHYRTIKGKEKIISQLKKKSKDKEVIYLATDPDREGEAIGWHIKEKLSKDASNFRRVVFHEITEDALKEAFAKPCDLDINKVNAQIARRVLDRIVGYYLSPLLWKKIVRGLSAGRVQSVALKFIVEREKEIGVFVPQTTYSVRAKFKARDAVFEAELAHYKNRKAVFSGKEDAQACIEHIKSEIFAVSDIAKKETTRKPPPPHTTSLLQQDGFNQLNFSSQKTMMVAQKLYEGIQIGDSQVGVITYMRTDSFHISPKAKQEAKDFIAKHFGAGFVTLHDYRHKEKKSAQLAHEAIRPTCAQRDPDSIRQFLTDDEYLLYGIVWKRFIAAFMREAIYENTKIFLASKSAEFVAEGRKIVFEGFLKVLDKKDTQIILPELAKGDGAVLEGLEVVEHTTKPPPRFNDASLVKLLEEKGIGRPSTYAPTISTLIRRNYVRRERGALIPSELGIKVNDLLVAHFDTLVNEAFTALMEEQLDEVEEGKLAWEKILEDFYPSFHRKVEEVNKLVKKEVVLHEKICPKCGSPMAVKWSRKGKFLSCSTFPKCRYAESILTDVACPLCKAGKLIERRNKRGQNFYGCSKFPDCRFTSRYLPKQGEQPQAPADTAVDNGNSQ